MGKRKASAPDDIRDRNLPQRAPYKKLRNREVFETAIVKSRNAGYRDLKNYRYPSGYGERPLRKRPQMRKQVTNDLIARRPFDPFDTPEARNILRFRDGKAEMAGKNISRNHILADSRIRVLLTDLLFEQPRRDWSEEQTSALEKFLKALCGTEEGPKLRGKFVEAYDTFNTKLGNEAIDAACEGRLNLRFGLSDINGKISNELDPVIMNGRLDPRTQDIVFATIGLAQAGVASHEWAREALAITKDKHTGEDVSSSVLRRGTVLQTSGSRTEIDLFAAPVNAASLDKHSTIDYGDLGGWRSSDADSRRPRAQAASREWHYSIRPAAVPKARAAGRQGMSDLL